MDGAISTACVTTSAKKSTYQKIATAREAISRHSINCLGKTILRMMLHCNTSHFHQAFLPTLHCPIDCTPAIVPLSSALDFFWNIGDMTYSVKKERLVQVFRSRQQYRPSVVGNYPLATQA
jgi:hypothetical protein